MKTKLTHIALALGLAILASTSAQAADKKPEKSAGTMSAELTRK
jgi:hypothetical protein